MTTQATSLTTQTAKPFALEIRLLSSITAKGFLTLDAVLAAAVYRRTGDLAAAHRDIPLQRYTNVCCGSGPWVIPVLGLQLLRKCEH